MKFTNQSTADHSLSDIASSSPLGPQGLPTLRPPYAIYFGDVDKIGFAKTGLGLIQWRRDLCLAQVRLQNCGIDGGLPDMSVKDVVLAGAQSLVIGVAPPGGSIPQNWICDLAEAARAGLDIVSGMHVKLSQFPEILSASRSSGSRLVDIRVPPDGLRVATGRKRTGKRLLTVGTDCAVGKKYTALALEAGMRDRGWASDFRATGQTGIMIAGQGIPIDAVVSDFLAGAAEALSPDAEMGHWDIIEGQGAISHPSYAGVCLGLLHGSQPDAMVLCHDPSRDLLLGFEGQINYPILGLCETMDHYLLSARRINPDARFVGISLNTSRLSDADRAICLANAAQQTALPVIDPIIDGVAPILDHIKTEFTS